MCLIFSSMYTFLPPLFISRSSRWPHGPWALHLLGSMLFFPRGVHGGDFTGGSYIYACCQSLTFLYCFLICVSVYSTSRKEAAHRYVLLWMDVCQVNWHVLYNNFLQSLWSTKAGRSTKLTFQRSLLYRLGSLSSNVYGIRRNHHTNYLKSSFFYKQLFLLVENVLPVADLV